MSLQRYSFDMHLTRPAEMGSMSALQPPGIGCKGPASKAGCLCLQESCRLLLDQERGQRQWVASHQRN